jgi:hypothetical protein
MHREYVEVEDIVFKQTIRGGLSLNTLLLKKIVSFRYIYFFAVLCLLNMVGCGEEPRVYKLNEEIPLGLGNLTVYTVEYNTLKKYIAPNTYEGARMADKMIKDRFLTSPDHVPVCIIFKYDTSDSTESKENQQKAISTFSVAQIYTMVDSENNKYTAKLLVPRRAVYYTQSGVIMDADDLKQVMQKLLWEDERVVAFSIPKNSPGLSLLIKNPIPREGQPKMVKVSLGP